MSLVLIYKFNSYIWSVNCTSRGIYNESINQLMNRLIIVVEHLSVNIGNRDGESEEEGGNRVHLFHIR